MDMIPVSAIVDAIRLWGERKNEDEEALRRRSEAIRLVMDAVVATKAYVFERDEQGKVSRADERELSRKWQMASMAISEYDFELYQSARLKALGWADPREWKRAAHRPEAIKLDLIIDQCDWLQKQK